MFFDVFTYSNLPCIKIRSFDHFDLSLSGKYSYIFELSTITLVYRSRQKIARKISIVNSHFQSLSDTSLSNVRSVSWQMMESCSVGKFDLIYRKKKKDCTITRSVLLCCYVAQRNRNRIQQMINFEVSKSSINSNLQLSTLLIRAVITFIFEGYFYVLRILIFSFSFLFRFPHRWNPSRWMMTNYLCELLSWHTMWTSLKFFIVNRLS